MALKNSKIVTALLATSVAVACSGEHGGEDDFSAPESVEPQVSTPQNGASAPGGSDVADARVGRLDGLRAESAILHRIHSSEPRAAVVVRSTETETTVKAGFSPGNVEIINEALVNRAPQGVGAQ